jgi:hypothetical protein
VPCFAALPSTKVTEGSARMVTEGTTISNLSAPSSLMARNASFSQASRTSPMPRRTKVVVAPRAPVSRIGTLPKTAATKSRALASSPPQVLSAYPQAAR